MKDQAGCVFQIVVFLGRRPCLERCQWTLMDCLGSWYPKGQISQRVSPPPPVYICQLRNLLHPPAVVTYLSIKFWCQVFAKPNKKMGGKQMNPSSR